MEIGEGDAARLIHAIEKLNKSLDKISKFSDNQHRRISFRGAGIWVSVVVLLLIFIYK